MVKLRRVYENWCFESQKDLDDLKDHLGDDLYNDYMKIRDRIPKDQNEYKDFQKLKKLPIEDVQNFVDNFQSEADKRKEAKKGAKKIYENGDWIVYKITTYPASKYYGSGTTWCITGRYGGHEERGEEYFNGYINNYNLDGGYYFFINKRDESEKYCLLLKRNDKVHSIWNAEDNKCHPEELLELADDLPFGDAMRVFIEGGDIDALLEKLERAYDDDDFETWAYAEAELRELDEDVNYPSFETLIEDNKPNMFSGFIHEFGMTPDKKELPTIIAKIYTHSDHPNQFMDELPDEKFDYMYDAFYEFSDLDKQMDFFNDYPCCDLTSLIKEIGFENLCDSLDFFSYDASEYLSETYDQKDVEDALYWGNEDPDNISKFLHFIEDELGQDISDFFTDVDELNLFYLIEDYLDKPETTTADTFNLITILYNNLGAKLDSSDAEELKETLDALDENKKNKIDPDIIKIINDSI